MLRKIYDCELSAARYFTPSQPAGRPAGWPKTKHQLAGRPAGHKPSPSWPAGRPQSKPQLAGRPAKNQAPVGRPAGQKPSPSWPAGHKPSPSWPAGRAPQTKNQLATVSPAEAKRQPASQPASVAASRSAGWPAGQKPSPANEMNECNERND